jgi:hypothetical protein
MTLVGQESCFAQSNWRKQTTRLLGVNYESFGFGKENLPQLQDYSPQRRGACDLYRSTP